MPKVSISRLGRGLALAIAICCAINRGPAFAGNLVTNGGFEDGDFTGWTVTGPQTGAPYVIVTGSFNDAVTLNPFAGKMFAALGFNGSDGTISQTMATIPGALYQVSYAYLAENGTPNDFTATFGSGAPLFSVTNDTSQGTNNPAVWSYQTYLVQATSSSTTLSFASRNDPDYSAVDAVSVIQVPEPSSIALLGCAAVGLMFAARRRKGACAAALN